jgi:hypothetical protein
LAICIRLNMPSYMRAPPEAQTTMHGPAARGAAFDQTGDELAHHRTHAGAEEGEIHNTQPDVVVRAIRPAPMLMAS